VYKPLLAAFVDDLQEASRGAGGQPPCGAGHPGCQDSTLPGLLQGMQ
jgi:hypothetical protein